MLLPEQPQQLTPNRQKILEALLFLLIEAADKKMRPTQYDIVKSVFIADFNHMNKYGRPVTYDNHIAMEYGPVPSLTYDMLKPNFNWAIVFGLPSAPWKCERAGNNAFHFFDPNRRPNTRVLSKSDMSALSDALAQVQRMGFKGVRDWTHDLPAYKDAWGKRGIKDAEPMKLELLLESHDPEEVKEMVFASQHLA